MIAYKTIYDIIMLSLYYRIVFCFINHFEEDLKYLPPHLHTHILISLSISSILVFFGFPLPTSFSLNVHFYNRSSYCFSVLSPCRIPPQTISVCSLSSHLLYCHLAITYSFPILCSLVTPVIYHEHFSFSPHSYSVLFFSRPPNTPNQDYLRTKLLGG